MLGLKKLLFRGSTAPHLADDIRAAVDAWRDLPVPKLESAHYHIRYVVVDVISSGTSPETDPLLGIAACSIRQGAIQPEDAFFVDFSTLDGEDGEVDCRLAAFLAYCGKSPLVTYHVPFVGGFLQRAIRERLGIDFQPNWVDMAWLMPSLYAEKSHTVMPLDFWIEAFGLDRGEGRRDAMVNNLLIARIFQMLLVRAAGKDIDTASRLIDESQSSSFLRRKH